MHKKFHYIWGAVLLLLFLILAVMVRQKFQNGPLVLNSFISDTAVQQRVFSLRTPSVSEAGKIIHLLFGPKYGYFLAAACLILILIFKKSNRWISALYLLLITGFCTLINPEIKKLIGRARPAGRWLVSESGPSFPSGHSIMAAALIGGLFFILASSLKNHFIQVLLGIMAALLILCVMASRVYLGVHYPSDTIGSLLLAFALLHLSYPLFYKFSHTKRTRHPK
ncbi:phosphatase PAP2 family protein [Lactovum odontotermitis]